MPHMCKMDLIYMYGDIYQERLKKNITNPFWRDAIQSLLILTRKQTFHGFDFLLAIPLWYNSRMIPWNFSTWVDKGITTIGDILYENGDVFTIADIKAKWNITCEFLLHLGLKKKSNRLSIQTIEFI